MKAEQHVIKMLVDRTPRLAYAERDVWDLLPAARGLTVIMTDGSVHPLPCGDGTAKQLLHLWSVQAAQG